MVYIVVLITENTLHKDFVLLMLSNLNKIFQETILYQYFRRVVKTTVDIPIWFVYINTFYIGRQKRDLNITRI